METNGEPSPSPSRNRSRRCKPALVRDRVHQTGGNRSNPPWKSDRDRHGTGKTGRGKGVFRRRDRSGGGTDETDPETYPRSRGHRRGWQTVLIDPRQSLQPRSKRTKEQLREQLLSYLDEIEMAMGFPISRRKKSRWRSPKKNPWTRKKSHLKPTLEATPEPAFEAKPEERSEEKPEDLVKEAPERIHEEVRREALQRTSAAEVHVKEAGEAKPASRSLFSAAPRMVPRRSEAGGRTGAADPDVAETTALETSPVGGAVSSGNLVGPRRHGAPRATGRNHRTDPAK